MRLSINKISLFAALLLSFQNSQAETNSLNPIIVTATKTAQTTDQALASVSVITRENIEQSQAKSIVEILRNQVGIQISQNGGLGKTSSVFIRGTESDHVLVLIDGIRASSSTLGVFSWSNYVPEQIERIEIVRGPRASLYGSEAIGGVIQIFTRNSQATSVSLTGGSNSTKQIELSHGGGDEWRYSIQAGHLDSDGIPSVAAATEDDGYDNSHAAIALTGHPMKNGELKIRVSHSQGESELDPSTGNNNFENRVISGELNYETSKQWVQKLTYGNTFDENESLSPTSPSTITTKRNSLAWQSDIIFGNDLLTFGADYYRDHATKDNSGLIDETINNKAAFLQHQFNIFNSDWIAGVRHDDHSEFGNHSTWNLGWGHDSSASVRVTASYGTAFKAPTVNDLFWPNSTDTFFGTTYISQGNVNLTPEKSSTAEIGIQKELSSTSKINAHAYHTKVENLINWKTTQTGANEFTSTPSNTQNVSIDGLDISLNLLLADWDISANATFLDAKDDARDKQLDRRPKRYLSVTGTHSFGKHYLFGEIITASKRLDRSGQAELRGYGVTNINYQYNFNKEITIQARVENLFDKKYVLATSFAGDWNTVDRSLYVSMQYRM